MYLLLLVIINESPFARFTGSTFWSNSQDLKGCVCVPNMPFLICIDLCAQISRNIQVDFFYRFVQNISFSCFNCDSSQLGLKIFKYVLHYLSQQ